MLIRNVIMLCKFTSKHMKREREREKRDHVARYNREILNYQEIYAGQIKRIQNEQCRVDAFITRYTLARRNAARERYRLGSFTRLPSSGIK